jgi:ATP-dependent Clp protease ATP-binding subunit ClpA
MDASTVMGVLRAVRDSLARARHVTMDDAALDEVAALADQFLPNRSFPDKGVDVIEQSIAHAVARGESTVTEATVREAMEQVVGVPLDPTSRLQALSAALADSGLLSADARSSLLARLGVSLRGLDSRGDSPDAVILLCDAAAPGAAALERIIATTIYGSDAALIALDVGSMADEQSLSTLIGSAPGLIGSDRPLPLADLRRDPRQVVAFHGIDRAAGVVRDTIASGLAQGRITDAMGRSLPLQAAIVVLSAPALTAELAPVALGPVLLGACDVVAATPGEAGARAAGDGWVRARLLDPLVARLRRQGVEVTLGDDFVGWVVAHAPPDLAGAEAFVDRDLAPRLVATLPSSASAMRAVLRDGEPALEPVPPG